MWGGGLLSVGSLGRKQNYQDKLGRKQSILYNSLGKEVQDHRQSWWKPNMTVSAGSKTCLTIACEGVGYLTYSAVPVSSLAPRL